jgi:hypothetical protein
MVLETVWTHKSASSLRVVKCDTQLHVMDRDVPMAYVSMHVGLRKEPL